MTRSTEAFPGQRQNALDKANEIRTRRAAFKRDVKTGRADVRAIITTTPGWALTMRVAEVLGALPGVGDERIRVWATKARVPAQAHCGKLTPRQRAELVELVGDTRAKLLGNHSLDFPECSPGRPLECRRCGTKLRVRVPDSLCGFCRAEDLEEAA